MFAMAAQNFAQRSIQTLMTLAIGGLYLCSSSGCKSLSVPSWNPKTWDMPFVKSDEKKHEHPDMDGVNPPQKLVALWSHTVLNSPGRPATRGLAGRIYFYDATQQPVPVTGQLVVYAYNDTVPQEDNFRTPDRKFVFSKEEFLKHYSESEFGASYSVWLPWDAVGGDHVELSIVPVLTTESGQAIMGEHSKHVLPGQQGIAKSSSASGSGSSSDVARVSFNGAATGTLNTPREAPTTIIVPESVKNRLMQSTDRDNTIPPNTMRIEKGQIPTWPTPSQDANTNDTTLNDRNTSTRRSDHVMENWSSGAEGSSQDPSAHLPSQPTAMSTHFAPARFPAPNAPFAQPIDVHTRSSPFPARSPFAPAQ
jgi:hypothetical protein